MAKTQLRDVSVVINGVTLSDHSNAVSTEDSADEVDVTSFSAAGYKEYQQGMKDATFTVTLFQDFATGSVHGTLQPLYAAGSTFSLVLKPTSAAVSATNPTVTMTARLFSYSGIDGSVGEASVIEATFRNASTAGPVWATS